MKKSNCLSKRYQLNDVLCHMVYAIFQKLPISNRQAQSWGKKSSSSNIIIHPSHEQNPASSLNGLKWQFFYLPSAIFSKANAIWPFAIHLLIMLFTFASFGHCFPCFVFHRISAVVVASLSFASLSPHIVLRWKQRSYCSKIQSSFCFLPCRTSMDSRKVLWYYLPGHS